MRRITIVAEWKFLSLGLFDVSTTHAAGLWATRAVARTYAPMTRRFFCTVFGACRSLHIYLLQYSDFPDVVKTSETYFV